MALIRLLRELFELTVSPASVPQMALMAKQIRVNFYFLRFEEVVFALNKGINSGYGESKKNLAYDTISKWLIEYQETDRLAAVTQRNEEKRAESTKLNKAEIPDELLYAFAKYIPPEPKHERKAPTIENLDEQAWSWFLSDREKYSDDQLQEHLADTIKTGFTKTAKAIQDEIHSRAKG